MSDWKNGIDLNEIAAKVQAAATDAVKAGAEVIFEESQDNVPVDFGDLKRSGKVEARGTKATIRYKDEVSIIVHENMTVEHRVGSAKFLEKAMNTRAADASKAIAERIRSDIGG